jgi:hypothetical protein
MGCKIDTLNVVTHKVVSQTTSKHIFTIRALCGYFEVYDMEIQKQYDTPFVQDNYTCEECLSAEGLRLLGLL